MLCFLRRQEHGGKPQFLRHIKPQGVERMDKPMTKQDLQLILALIRKNEQLVRRNERLEMLEIVRNAHSLQDVAEALEQRLQA